MGFKLKHIFRAPAKLLNKLGQTGILGVRKNHFRILGIKVGKDLLPIVQGALCTASIACGTPFLIGVTGLPTAAASIITSAATSGIMSGLSGGNDASVMKSTLLSAASAAVSTTISNSNLDFPEKIAAHAIGNTFVNLASGSGLQVSIVNSIIEVPCIVVPNNITVKCMCGAIKGAVSDDNILRGILTCCGSAIVNDFILNLLQPDFKEGKVQPSLVPLTTHVSQELMQNLRISTQQVKETNKVVSSVISNTIKSTQKLATSLQHIESETTKLRSTTQQLREVVKAKSQILSIVAATADKVRQIVGVTSKVNRLPAAERILNSPIVKITTGPLVSAVISAVKHSNQLNACLNEGNGVIPCATATTASVITNIGLKLAGGAMISTGIGISVTNPILGGAVATGGAYVTTSSSNVSTQVHNGVVNLLK